MTVELGRYGIWRHEGALSPELADPSSDRERVRFVQFFIELHAGDPATEIRIAERGRIFCG